MAGTTPTRRKSDKLMRDALMVALHREIAPTDDRIYLAQIAQKAVEMAADGNERMIAFIAERIDGKALQPVGGDEDAAPIRHVLTWGGDDV